MREIPYQVNKAKIVERIAQLVNDKVIDDISDVRDESGRDGMRVVVELKRGAEAQIILNQLFKHTQMQESFSMIFLAVVNGQPKEMGLVQAMQHFIDHRVDVVRRRTVYLLEKAREREHILRATRSRWKYGRGHQDHSRIGLTRGSQRKLGSPRNTRLLIKPFRQKLAARKGSFHHARLMRFWNCSLSPYAAFDRRNPERTGRDSWEDCRIGIHSCF